MVWPGYARSPVALRVLSRKGHGTLYTIKMDRVVRSRLMEMAMRLLFAARAVPGGVRKYMKTLYCGVQHGTGFVKHIGRCKIANGRVSLGKVAKPPQLPRVSYGSLGEHKVKRDSVQTSIGFIYLFS
ncbi:hypothetical protein PR002_g12676 [Phytophthora rubi]|uniref:Uncharacterized protein n=1 Tax=Phytophthora rubi TaxID=129364 RepID=A0A6A3LP08_9STRA|nr:hypothetical protein PR002_g12676 [Phytophthora rubi]